MPLLVKKPDEQSLKNAGKKLYEKVCVATDKLEKNNKLNLVLIALICVAA